MISEVFFFSSWDEQNTIKLPPTIQGPHHTNQPSTNMQLISTQTRKHKHNPVSLSLSWLTFLQMHISIMAFAGLLVAAFERENSLGTKTSDNRNPSMWTSFLPLLGNQTLSQYLSPDSIYSAQHTTHLNSHLVSQSLLSTAMQCIFHFPLQMVPVLHSAVHTHSYHGYKQKNLFWPNLLELVIHLF